MSEDRELDIIDEAVAQIPSNADYVFTMVVFPENADHIIGGAWAWMPGELSAYDYQVVSDVLYTVSFFQVPK